MPAADRQRLLFITIAGYDVGFGHLRRCLTLAAEAAGRGWETAFLIFGDEAAGALLEKAGHEWTAKPIAELCDPIATRDVGGRVFDAAVLDAAHPVVLADRARALALLEEIRTLAHRFAVIDALGPQTFAAKFVSMPIDILVAPYVGAEPVPNATWRTLNGPAYAVLSPVYDGLPERSVRAKADRILVSCGGSDPAGLSTMILDGIERVRAPLEVRLIVGPFAGDNVKAHLRDIAAASRHAVLLVPAPDDLVEHMLWCDLAIATSGLTKYELAATSTPAIILSSTEADHAVNQPFASMGTIVDLGTGAMSQSIADHLTRLLDSPAERLALAASGRRLVDGKGTERVITEIIGSSRAKP